MIVKNNSLSSMVGRLLKKNDNDNLRSARNMTSGYKINSACDNASGLGISEKMRSQIKGLDQASNNSQDAISMTQVIEGGLNEVHDMLHRIQKISIQSANEINSYDDRRLLDKEVQELKKEIDRIATDTEFNGKKVLDGTYGSGGRDISFQVGENKGYVISLEPIDSVSCDSLQIKDLTVLTKESSKSGLDLLSKAVDSISSRRVDIGSVQNRLQHSRNSVDNSAENMTASESRIRDADIPSEIMENVKSNILIKSTESVIAQANQNPEYVLTLLNGR